MKKLLFLLFIIYSNCAIAQNDYWQQYLHYNIDAELNVADKTISGKETIVYKNNSPDKLDFIWFHIYPNAYKDNNTALIKQIKNDPSRKGKLKKFSTGYITDLNFTINGEPAKFLPHPNEEYIDIIKLVLNKPLLPGESINIYTPFKVKLPSYFSRSGFSDGEFIVCQWYPKPAVYDKNGWHEMPYLDMGEFYSEYAAYNVNLTVPANYVVSATGILQTANEAKVYKEIGIYNNTNRNSAKPKMYAQLSTEATKTLSFVADSVPDFAWFADKNFVIQYDTIKLNSESIIDAYSFYYDKKNTEWVNSIDFIKNSVHSYSDWIGNYSYPIVQAVEGPKNNASGGMEYPTVTLITNPDATAESLDVVIAHEVGHNWFMSMLGTNERQNAWMDEGLNSYFQYRYEAGKYRTNSVFGKQIPKSLKKLNEEEFLKAIYSGIQQVPFKFAIETPSQDFRKSQDYGLTIYVKTAGWMYLLESKFGREKIDNAFQYYFNKWKFKHPHPSDIKIAFEESLGENLDSFFQMLSTEGSL